MTSASPPTDRLIRLSSGSALLPERLLLAHARGQVLFITGAGTSLSSGLPDFRRLVLNTYQAVDTATHAILVSIPAGSSTEPPLSVTLPAGQRAEVRRFLSGDFDVVLGMLERRLEGTPGLTTNVREAVCSILRSGATGSAPIHRSIMRLSDRGGATTVVTTNFDRLLESARTRSSIVPTYSLGAIPRPGRTMGFSGILHIHGVLDPVASRSSELILSDQDFGEFYLRRRVVPDFIYDAARLYHLVLVGYSANDPPMRYLLNAVAADGSRFDDLKERFSFVGTPTPPDQVNLEDWRGRGITPIPYSEASAHAQVATTLERWAELSPINGARSHLDATLRRLVALSRNTTSDEDRDLFDHLVRRSDRNERQRISRIVADAGADIGWLDAILTVAREREHPIR